jgi:hypothetical protein
MNRHASNFSGLIFTVVEKHNRGMVANKGQLLWCSPNAE